MIIDREEQEIRKRVGDHLEESLRQLDAETLRGLRRGRLLALEQAGRRRLFPQWLTAGGIATAAVILVSLTFIGKAPAPLPHHPEEVEILTSQDNPAIFEDIEFLRWLAAAERQRTNQ